MAITLTRLVREIPSNINPDKILANMTGDTKYVDNKTATKCFEIYKNTHDKKAVKEIFKATTGVEYPDLVSACSGVSI